MFAIDGTMLKDGLPLEIAVTDFWIFRLSSPSSRLGMPVMSFGEPGYVSPRIIRRKEFEQKETKVTKKEQIMGGFQPLEFSVFLRCLRFLLFTFFRFSVQGLQPVLQTECHWANAARLTSLLRLSILFRGSMIAVAIMMSGSFVAISAEPVSINWLTGPKLQKELERPFGGSWTRAEFRQVVKEVAADRHVAILIDRRLDPSAEFPVEVMNATLRSGLVSIAELVHGEIAVSQNFVYLGPATATKRLRTLIELRKNELRAKDVSEKRRPDLQRHRTFAWDDLESPRDILDKIAKQYQLSITHDERVPHDLWAATVLPDSSLAEVLSVVLIQFDLTFRWTNSGNAIELIPIPVTVSLEQKHRFKPKPADAISLIREQFPEIDAKISNSEILIRGSVEDHEAVVNLFRGDAPKRNELPLEVRRQKFTYSAEQPIPIIEVMKLFEQSDIHFEYDQAELKKAGIDLNKTIQLDVKNVTADEFFKLLFGPVRLDFRFDRMTVKLKPSRSGSARE